MSDETTARAFADSWNHVGSVYTRAQYLEWIAPLTPSDIEGRDVLELGSGNGSLLVHTAALEPRRLVGVELGDTLEQTRRNLGELAGGVELLRGDLTEVNAGEFDVVYCIGVLHHLQAPRQGFEAVLRHTKRGGRFHCWVYAREGNAVVRWIVDPIRRIVSRLPWWLTKYLVALPMVIPYFLYAKVVRLAPRIAGRLPLGAYTLWIGGERFGFFHHVAFDQLVTPRTVYLTRSEIESWMADARIDREDRYIVMRNGNSWKFGGLRVA